MLTEDILNENHSLDIPESIIDNEVYNLVKDITEKPGFNPHVKFDPKIHLTYHTNKNITKRTLSDLQISKTHVKPMSEVAAVEPFSLFTVDAIDIMKWEIFANKHVLDVCGRIVEHGEPHDLYISGFSDYTPFTKDAFTHPETVEIFNRLMGVDVHCPHTFHLSHINAVLAPRKRGEPAYEETAEELTKLREQQDAEADSIPNIGGWHYDSPPMVCVVMFSAPPNMVRGETAIRTGTENEDVLRFSNGQVGQATLLQGRIIKHIATKPLNKCDRITYVASLLPKDPEAYDSSSAQSERPGAASTFTNDRFYPNLVNYRMERIKKRLENYQNKIMDNYSKGIKFDQLDSVEFMKDIEDYLHRTWINFEAVSDEPFPPPVFDVPYKDL